MKVKYTLLHASGRVERLTAEFHGTSARERLADIHRVFDRHMPGCEMEHVLIWSDEAIEHQYLDMFVDEIGHEKRLPFNEDATLMYWANMREHEPEKFAGMRERGELDVIAGDAIVFEGKVWE